MVNHLRKPCNFHPNLQAKFSTIYSCKLLKPIKVLKTQVLLNSVSRVHSSQKFRLRVSLHVRQKLSDFEVQFEFKFKYFWGEETMKL